MADHKKGLERKFQPEHRYSTFGPSLNGIRVRGFRGVQDLSVQFEHPITAFSGLNGAGKSTIGQLVVCAYKQPVTSTKYKRYYVKDFFPVSAADPQPFSDSASVEFKYATDSQDSKSLTVSRKEQRWRGYEGQPERHCFYVGFTLYIPKVERRDLSVYNAASIDLRDSREIPKEVRQHVASILQQPYEQLAFQTIGHQRKEAELGMATCWGKKYSENNMGFGEGRVLYLVDMLETKPEQSLFVLEEPVTSLHEDAQYRLSRYLIEVCARRHHQIILSTHSSVILEALPQQSRKLLLRKDSGVSEYPGISANRVRAVLSRGHTPALTVCVEDSFAKALLIAIVRWAEPELLDQIAIIEVGDTKRVVNFKRLLEDMSLDAIVVRDGDVGSNPSDRVYSLPGDQPEATVFNSPQCVKAFDDHYGIHLPEFLSMQTETDAHYIPKSLAARLSLPVDHVITFATQSYVKGLDSSDYRELIEAIRGAPERTHPQEEACAQGN